jgi:transcriptional regulator with XRE-family HTH domain
MNPGTRIKARRKELRLTQEEVCAKTGMGQSTLSDLERGKTNMPTLEHLHALAEVLGVSQNWILYGTEGELRYPSKEQMDILDRLDRMTDEQRLAVIATIKSFTN